MRAAGGVLLLAASLVIGASPAGALQDDEEHPVTGRLLMRVDATEPIITMVSRWAFFPREEYPWDQIGEEDPRFPIHPTVLTAYVNYGCHFEGWVKWRYEEREVELLPDGWVRRRLDLTREEQGGFFNNNLKFKCELVTKHRGVNRRLGELVTLGGAPEGGFQMGMAMGALMRVLEEINTLDLTEGTWGDYLYRTFKSILTFDLMDADTKEIDLFVSPEGDVLEFEIEGDRTVVFER